MLCLYVLQDTSLGQEAQSLLTVSDDDATSFLQCLHRIYCSPLCSSPFQARQVTWNTGQRLRLGTLSAGALIVNMLQEDRGGAAGWWKRPAEAWGPGQRLLACGAQVIAELRAAVREELGYSCSAGMTLLVFACNGYGPAACILAGARVERLSD